MFRVFSGRFGGVQSVLRALPSLQSGLAVGFRARQRAPRRLCERPPSPQVLEVPVRCLATARRERRLGVDEVGLDHVYEAAICSKASPLVYKLQHRKR